MTIKNVWKYYSLSCVWLFATPWTEPTRLLCPRNSPGKNTGGVAIPFSRGSSWPREQTQVSCIAGRRFFTVWATRGAREAKILPNMACGEEAKEATA